METPKINRNPQIIEFAGEYSYFQQPWLKNVRFSVSLVVGAVEIDYYISIASDINKKYTKIDIPSLQISFP